MNIEIKNDGKQRWLSFEGSYSIDFTDFYGSYGQVCIEGYGQDEKEVLKNMTDKTKEVIENLEQLLINISQQSSK